MYGILLREGKIEDPFFADNEKRLRPLADRNCAFETTVPADAALLACRTLLLCFEGIDTVADITINGRHAAHSENMHRVVKIDVKPFFTLGENTVRVEIHSPTKYIAEKQRLHPVPGNGESLDGVAQIRKASYMMGWDWGPVLPDMGLWRPVKLIARKGAALGDTAIRQFHEDGRVRLVCRTATENAAPGADVTCTLRSPGGKILSVQKASAGCAEFTVDAPELWWPRGYGEQPLYQITVTLTENGLPAEEKNYRIGLRTLTVSTERDDYGNEFCFVINGLKIFAMGANYVPQDNLLSRVTPERIEALIRQCADANFNMIRVWGGGYYPDDVFYDLCDRYGLIVWQDFMIACNSVWLTEETEKNLMAEFRDNLLRIRHHACLGLLNGNNEVEEFMASGKPPRNTPLLAADYLRLYHHLLPELCADLAPDVFYWPSSPSSGQSFDGHPSDENRGDAHFWTVWHGWKPYETYREHYFRFCSEFGFEALPDLRTVERFTRPKDRNLFSPVMLAHQKCRMGNGKIMSYLSDYYLYPQSFEGVVYGSQLLQADAIRTAVEHFRRHRGRCMGSLYWQLNDCWPTVSWSSVDSEGRKKALHYAAKKFYAPVLLSAEENGTHVRFSVSNETRRTFTGKIRLELRKNDLTLLSREEIAVSVPVLTAEYVCAREYADAAAGIEDQCLLAYSLLDETGAALSEAVLLFVRPKCFRYLRPEITARVLPAGEDGVFLLRLQSTAFVHKLQVRFDGIEPELAEQFVDLTAAEGTELRLWGVPGVTAGELEEKIRYFSVYDIAPECFAEE